MTYTQSTQIDTKELYRKELRVVHTYHGTENISIVDNLLTTEEAAIDRAESIFLDQSYIHEILEIETYFRDEIHIGDIIEYNSKMYKIKEVIITGEKSSIKMNIKVQRWD